MPEKEKNPEKQFFNSVMDIGLAHLFFLCVCKDSSLVSMLKISLFMWASPLSFPKTVLKTRFIWRCVDLWIGAEMSVMGKGS